MSQDTTGFFMGVTNFVLGMYSFLNFTLFWQFYMQNFDYLPLAVNFLHFNGFLLLAVSVDMAVSSLVLRAERLQLHGRIKRRFSLLVQDR